ncbi:pentapeptide repeat-containing protein [Streptomyces milbemycinicus]|uniref:Pentapeptide repeat-containing protein n=1 Tax=Streptomyces milbemycinicus TaxID=476552 RepID=A0ABW8LUX3_9ACTN
MAQISRQGSRIARIKNPTAPKLPPSLRAAEERDTLEDDAIIKGVRYESTHFVGLEAEAVEFESCMFENTRFTGTELRRSQFSDSAFNTCDFSQVTAHDVSLIRCTITGSRITGSSWKSGTFRDVRIEGCISAPAMYRYMKLYSVVFTDCKMAGADFQSTSMHNVRFDNCDLTGAQFSNAQMGTVRFENCTLNNVGGAASLKGATVQGPGSMELALSLAREAGILFEDY